MRREELGLRSLFGEVVNRRTLGKIDAVIDYDRVSSSHRTKSYINRGGQKTIAHSTAQSCTGGSHTQRGTAQRTEYLMKLKAHHYFTAAIGQSDTHIYRSPGWMTPTVKIR